CNGLEPCISCEAANIRCTYDTLSPTKKKAHDNYVIMNRQEQAQRLRSPDVIVAQFEKLVIAGTTNNFGPILSHVINLPRTESFTPDHGHHKSLKVGRAEEFLIDCYFNHFNYYIPILNRKAFMEQVKDPNQREKLDVQKLLACVLATGFAFRHEPGNPPQITNMNPEFGSRMCHKFHELNTPDVFRSSIENCQCYLILTGYYSFKINYDAVHNLVSLAHSTSASLGLNRKTGVYYRVQYRGMEHTVDTIEMGHRVFWSVVTVCAGYSLYHPSPIITSNDYDIDFPRRQLSDKHWDFQKKQTDDYDGIKDLYHFAPMYEIISRIADITSTSTKRRPHNVVGEAREELKGWRTKTLPQELRIDPADIGAIGRQSRFSKFNHAVSYMFEISMHQSFQLHESQREQGIHEQWSTYAYHAAVGIKNIYNTRSMTRMNAHVILPVAAGAFVDAVDNNLQGLKQNAWKYYEEIEIDLAEIVRTFTNTERDDINKKRKHMNAGMASNGEIKDEPRDTPSLNDQSPSHTADSSPTQATDTTAETENSEEDDQRSDSEDNTGNKRPFYFAQPPLGQQGFIQQNQNDHSRRMAQYRGHPSMGKKSRQQPLEMPYNFIPQNSISSPSYLNTPVSPHFPLTHSDGNNDQFSYSARSLPHHHHHHRTFSGDGAKMTPDSGFVGGIADTYPSQRPRQGTRPLFPPNTGQSVHGGELSRSHNSVISPSTGGGTSGDIFQLNDNHAMVAAGKSTQGAHALGTKTQLTSAAPAGYNNQPFYSQFTTYSAIGSTLSASKLLAGGGSDGTGLMTGLPGSISYPSGSYAMSTPSAMPVNKLFPDLSSPVSPNSIQQQQGSFVASNQAGMSLGLNMDMSEYHQDPNQLMMQESSQGFLPFYTEQMTSAAPPHNNFEALEDIDFKMNKFSASASANNPQQLLVQQQTQPFHPYSHQPQAR
ncbi:hypothetical protein BGZ65_006774, partial [Modicella reniformis]